MTFGEERMRRREVQNGNDAGIKSMRLPSAILSLESAANARPPRRRSLASTALRAVSRSRLSVCAELCISPSAMMLNSPPPSKGDRSKKETGMAGQVKAPAKSPLRVFASHIHNNQPNNPIERICFFAALKSQNAHRDVRI